MSPKFLFLILIGSTFVSTANAVVTTNRWADASGGEHKWETASEWSLGVPPSQAQNYTVIDEKLAGSGKRNIVIDSDTVLSNAINGCLTINNLALSLAPNVLHVDDTGSTALTVLQTLSISNSSTLIITNSTVTLAAANASGTQFGVDGSVMLESGTITVAVNTFDGSYGPFSEIIGVNLSGTLTVAGGLNSVAGSGVVIGYNAGSVGTVLITGGTLSMGGDNNIGWSGVGSLIQSGGTAEMIGEFLGVNFGAEGTLTVAGGEHLVVGTDGLNISSALGTTGTVWVTGGTLETSGTDTLIGDFGVGSLIQSNGTVFVQDEILGKDGGEGLLVVAGGTHVIEDFGLIVGYSVTAGSVWFTGGSLLATNLGGIVISLGFLTQSNGTLAASGEAVGEAPFSGLEGIGGAGTLTIAGGIHAVGFGGLTVGDIAGSTGTVWFTGGQLLATSFSNIIGNDAVGSLVQSNGEMQMIFSEYVGNSAGGEGTLTVAGGTHTVEDGELTVGNSAAATGSVWVTGGQLATDSAVIGLAGVGQMSVSNGNWQAGDVSVGAANGGQGTLTVAGGTSVVSSDLTIGTPDCTGRGTVIVNSGSLFVTNAAHNAVLDLESGTLTLRGGNLVVDVLVKTNPCALFQQTGGRLVVGGVTTIVSPPVFSVISISRNGNDMRITWQTPGGVTNAIQATNGGLGGSYNTNFNDLASFIFGPSGEVTNTYVDVGGATNMPSRFYRIRLVP
jgi:hypothetical protein